MGNDVSRPNQSGNANKFGSKKVSRRMSVGAGIPPRPPAIRVGGSTGFLDVNNIIENGGVSSGSTGDSPPRHSSLSIDQLSPRSRSGSQASGSQSPNKQPNKQRRCSLTMKNRQLIQSCFNNPHENIGARILKRSAEKRKDFGRFFLSISSDQRETIADTIKQLLKKSVAHIYGTDEELQSLLATEFGQRFVEFRVLGFKADFFAVLADSTITECVLLDAAVHPAALTLTAFSQFITMLFSAVRDGFYTEMRRLRRTSNSFSTNGNSFLSGGSMKKLSVDDSIKVNQALQMARSVSPSPEPHSAGEKTANSSPIRHGSQESIEEEQEEELNNNNNNSSSSRTGSRKITSESLKSKEELRVLTAEFLGGRRAMTVGGKEHQNE